MDNIEWKHLLKMCAKINNLFDSGKYDIISVNSPYENKPIKSKFEMVDSSYIRMVSYEDDCTIHIDFIEEEEFTIDQINDFFSTWMCYPKNNYHINPKTYKLFLEENKNEHN